MFFSLLIYTSVLSVQSRVAKSCLKCAYVIPTYELADDQLMPANKTQLLRLVKAGKAR